MSDPSKHDFQIPPEQQAIKDKCFHPSGTFVEFPIEDVETSIPARFEKIVRSYPDQLAVKTPQRSLTYEELNNAANQVAHLLLAQRGNRPEPIGIYLLDQTATIIALLGILKAGKFFLPLDTAYPKARNEFVIWDCGTEVIVSDRASVQGVAELFGQDYQVVVMEDAERSELDENPGITITADSLAYVLHTSGSTGNFKGVAENQVNVLHEIRCFVNQIHLSRSDRLTLLHSLSFRAAELHLFGSLLTGAALLPLDVAGYGSLGIADWLRREEITVWHSIPTVFRRMIEPLSGDYQFRSVRLVHLSGAPVNQNDVENYRKYFSRDSIFLHRIGATETQTISWRLMDQTTAMGEGPIPLGWAPEGKQLLLLDESGQEVAVGETGEIALKSRFLAQGYWKRPELSKERFRSDPSGGSEQLYLTGDLGRMTAECGLILLGRKDLQLKIRGYRIEPELIERVLLSHPGVKDAVVIGAIDKAGSEKLVSYFTSAMLPGPTVETLRRFLKDKLPDYMIPSGFVQLDAIPLTPNGKVDRRLLPSPTTLRPHLEVGYMEPTSATELQLVGIWQEVLEIYPIGVHDNFFDLGGHSLAASRVISRVIQTFNLELPVNALFEAPNVAEMAAIITRNQTKHANDGLVQLLRKAESMTEAEVQTWLAGERARSLKENGHE